MLHTINLNLNAVVDFCEMGRVLSSPQRLAILSALNETSLSITELSKLLGLPMSSTVTNVDLLENCGLIATSMQYNKKGKTRICARCCDCVNFHLHHAEAEEQKQQTSVILPIGTYTDYRVSPSSCGMATEYGNIGSDNDLDIFFSPERFHAKLIWFGGGYLEYRVSKAGFPPNMKELEISFEACSEAPFYRNNYKSDVTLWINGIEIGTWTSPGDFGGRRGILNPDWWPNSMTQYGILTTWQISKTGSVLNNEPLSDVTLSRLKLFENPNLTVRIGIKDSAYNQGGLNLFGSSFGDYQQDIVVKAKW